MAVHLKVRVVATSQSTYGGFHLAQSWAGSSLAKWLEGALHGLVARPGPLLPALHAAFTTALYFPTHSWPTLHQAET